MIASFDFSQLHIKKQAYIQDIVKINIAKYNKKHVLLCFEKKKEQLINMDRIIVKTNAKRIIKIILQ